MANALCSADTKKREFTCLVGRKPTRARPYVLHKVQVVVGKSTPDSNPRSKSCKRLAGERRFQQALRLLGLEPTLGAECSRRKHRTAVIVVHAMTRTLIHRLGWVKIRAVRDLLPFQIYPGGFATPRDGAE